jgi:phosphoglucosamine mutase
MGRFFGTDGVRGIANVELTNDLAYKLGRYGAHVLTEGRKHVKILIGKDTRISGDMLEASLAAGIMSMGGNVVSLGVVPTPAVAFLTRYFNADAGVVISASHNPAEYNGIKFFNKNGYKLADEIEDRIEKYILGGLEAEALIDGDHVGTWKAIPEAYKLYCDHLVEKMDVDFSGMKVAIDCANGAATTTAAYAFSKMNAEVSALCCDPDGHNINKGCGSTHVELIAQKVKSGDYALGMAFDGDADRLIAVDETGEVVDGDKIMAICADYLKEVGELKKDTLVTTVMSNMGLFAALGERGINIEKTRVGDRYVLEKMLAEGYNFGGEQSGHLIFLDHNTTGDGLLSALMLMRVMKKRGKKLSELKGIMETFPQVLINAKVDNDKKHDYIEDEVIRQSIKQTERFFNGQGRVLVRASGTEPLVRVMIEGKDQSVLEQKAKELVELIEKRLG